MESPLRVLIVDDNPHDRALAIHELRRSFAGMEPIEIGGPAELERVITAGGFDVVITDYALRWSDGLAVFGLVKERYPTCPVIMFTGTGTQEVAVAAMKAGLDDYVVKSPAHFVRLASAVGAALERASSRQRLAALEQERAQLLVREQEARAAAEAAERRATFLAEASVVLGSSLDYEPTLQRVAQLMVPDVADWCGVDIVAEDGTLQRLAAVHVDPEKVAQARTLQQRYPPNPQNPTGALAVAKTGKRQFFPIVTDAQLVAAARDEEHLEILRSLGFTSALIVPLIARERSLGALSLVTAESGRRFDASDLQFAEELARRAGLAIDNARLYRDAQLAIRTRDQFLSVAAHELKTPLTTLSGYIELLQRRLARMGEVDPRIERAVLAVAAQYDRLQALVVELLSVARLQEDLFQFDVRAVDLQRIANRVVDTLRPTTERHALEFHAVEGPLLIRGDDRHLEHVLTNLVHNAIKYSPDGGTIRVEVMRHSDHACISVRDQGIGIPETAQKQLFQRFFRAENAVAQQISGFGIGLYLVKEIVTRLGGTIDLSSIEGQGSTFTVCFPLLGTAPGSPGQ